MDRHLIGQSCALAAAVCWAIALVLFKRSGEKIQPIPLNLFKNVVGLILFGLTLLVAGDGIGVLSQFPVEDIYILLVSGLIGIALADTLLFYALNLVGVGIISIVDCTYSPIIILLSHLMIGESLTVYHYAGTGLILLGVLSACRVSPPKDRTRRQLVAGMLLGVASIAVMGYGIVLAKPVLEVMDFPLVWATTLRLGAGTLVLAVWALALTDRREIWAAFRPAAHWKYSLPASILGTYFALLFWVAGFKYTWASVAGMLNQTSVVFALIFATFILKERFSRRKAVAVCLALTGVAVVRVYG
ncbi:MAG: DMT family transporter [Phycisphaerae bacterium]